MGTSIAPVVTMFFGLGRELTTFDKIGCGLARSSELDSQSTLR
jgi:hypothetical protein